MICGKSTIGQDGSIPPELNELARKVVDAAYRVHWILGPGLFESVYEACLLHELRKRGVRCENQKAIPVFYDNIEMGMGFRADVMVEDCLIVEIKTVDMISPAHKAQVITYLRLTGCKLGLLINFNAPTLKSGIRRIVSTGSKVV